MDKRIQIKRATSDTIRELIAEQISTSVTDLRGDLPAYIEEVLAGLDFSTSQLRKFPDLDTLFREVSINDILDLLYIDAYVQYADMFNLQDNLVRVKSMFDSTTISMLNRIGEISSKVRDLTSLSGSRLSFTNTIHETFNSQSNRTSELVKLGINPAAGLLRLDGSAKNYCTPTMSSVYLNLISESVRQVDTTDPSFAYNNDPTDPYYTTLVTNVYPSNPSYPIFSFDDYTGAIVDLVIRFTGVFPINRISFAPFSTGPIDIIGVFYSETTDAQWEELDLVEIELNEINKDNVEIEINFERVYARELHVLLRQDKFVMSESEVEIVETNNLEDYLEYCSTSLERVKRDGFFETVDVSAQVLELVSDMKEESMLPIEQLDANARSYVLGVYNLSAYDVNYNTYGSFGSNTTSLRGNLSSASLAIDGNLWHISDSGSYDTAGLFSIVTAEREVPLGVPLNAQNEIIDAVLIEENTKFEQGAMVQSPTHIYRLSTHFIPDDNYIDQIEIYADGQILNLPEISSSGIIVNKQDYGVEIELPTEYVLDNDIYDGSVVTMKYVLADTDRFGRNYDVSSVDILTILGKPNISDNTSTDIFSQYIYTVERDQDGVVTFSRSYEDTEYSPVIVSGELYYCVYDGKGETVSGDVISISNKKYVKESSVVGPFDDFYYGAIREEPVLVESGIVSGEVEYNIFHTDKQYVKDTMKVFREGYYTPGVGEYETDTDLVVLTGDNKKKFMVPSEAGTDVLVSYIPIDKTHTSRYIDTNISQFNKTERYTRTTDKKISLERFPFVDRSIIASPNFDFTNGLFSLKYKYSIVYEPMVVYVNGVKAINITEYRTGKKPVFQKKKRATDYRFYVEAGNTVVFNEDIIGNIVIYYYVLSDSFSTKVSMYKSNYLKTDISPELYNYTILANVQR